LVRAGEGVAIGGWDGSALSPGSQFLPAGELRFEFGVDQQIKAKADKEWARHEPANTVFVFATPRRWGNAQSWAADRRSEGKFADVWVIDADVLEGWLALAPAVHYWISEQLGRRPHDAQSIETWWDRFSAQTKPQLPESLFLAGRNDQAGQLQKFIAGRPGLLTVRSEWANDGKAFVYAASRPREKESAQVPVILVDTAEVWDRIIAHPFPAVLIPTFENADVATATGRGHHVVLILNQLTASTEVPDLILARLERIAAAEALQTMNIAFDTAQRYAVHARRNLQAFVRSISVNPAYRQPPWAMPPTARSLSKLMLVGEWTTQEADLKLVEELAGKPWEIVEQDLDHVSGTDDPVFRKIGDQWSLTAPGEAFVLLGPALKATDLATWAEVLRDCLLETDPTLDLSDDDRPFAAIHGVHREYSNAIRKGMARAAALLGARGDTNKLDDQRTLAEHAKRSLGAFFSAAVADKTGRKWREIIDVLPLLAEGAPDEFLEAVARDLASPEPGLLQLFQDAKEPPAFSLGPNSPHPWLLWAIETVMWSDDYFLDGVRVMSKLAALDPGGRTGNRPIDSLATVLCGWVRHTSADVDQKIQALSVVRDTQLDVCWDLLLKLWPGERGFITSPASPHVQDWQPASSSVLMADWVKFTHVVAGYAIDLATGNGERIAKLVEGLGDVPESDQSKILDLLRSSASTKSSLTDEERFQLWECIHELVGRHERFSSAAWSFKPDILAQLKAVLTDLEPASDPKRFAYLFDWHPDLPGVDSSDIEAHGAMLTKLQAEALDQLLQGPNALDELEVLTRQARVPSHVGWALASDARVELSAVAPWLSSSEPSLREAASGWFTRKSLLEGAPWLERALSSDDLVGDARALAIRNIPSQRSLWDVLATRPTDDDSYWQNTYVRAFNLPTSDIEMAVDRLVAHDRSWTAIQVLSDALHPAAGQADAEANRISTELVIDTLNRAITEDPRPQDVSNMTSYYTGTLLDYLEKFGTNESVMARFEFAFFRLLEHTRQPRVLSSVLAKDPAVFVDLAKRVYRGRREPKADLSEQEQQLVNQAWWVLKGWTGYPGCRDDGTVDVGVLNAWIKGARLQFSESDRADIGDELIGESLARSGEGQDGAWPAEPVREIIETIGSEKLENGFIIGRRNARGMTTRGPYEGGGQERALADKYRGWSKAVKAASPRTARILRALADTYEDDGRREDIRAELDADRD
jgi:hypothetical protein